jgi:hypothetical protein
MINYNLITNTKIEGKEIYIHSNREKERKKETGFA